MKEHDVKKKYHTHSNILLSIFRPAEIHAESPPGDICVELLCELFIQKEHAAEKKKEHSAEKKMVDYLKKGELLYMILCICLVTIVAFIPLGPNMLPSGQAMPASARGLTMGIEIITGLAGCFALPYFAKHPQVWG